MENQRNPSPHSKQPIIDLLARCSHSLESIHISGMLVLFSLFFMECLAIIFPLLSILKGASASLAIYYPINYFYSSFLGSQPDISFYFQIGHALIILIIISLIIKIGLRICTGYYYISGHLFIFTSQPFYQDNQIFDIRLLLNIFNIITGITICIFYSIIRWSYSCKSVNYLMQFPNKLKAMVDISFKICSLLVPFILIKQSHKYYLALTIFYLFLYLLQAYTLLSFFTYFRELTNIITRGMLCIKFAIFILILISLSSDIQLLHRNFLVVTLSISIFSYVAMGRYLLFHHQVIEFAENEAIDNEKLGLLFVYTVIRTFLKESKNSDERSSILASSYRYEHINQCTDNDCECFKYNPKNFETKFIKNKLEAILKLFEKDPQVTTFINVIKLQCFEVYTLFVYKMKKIQQISYDDWFFNFISKKYSKSLSEYIDKKKAMKNGIDTQKVIEMDLIVEKVEDLLLQVSTVKAQFWYKIFQGTSTLSQIDANIKQQLKLNMQVYEFQQKITNDYQENTAALILLISYYIYIELLLKAPPKLKNLLTHNFQHKNRSNNLMEKGIKPEKDIVHQMYGKNSCTVETKIDPVNSGQIINCSKTVYDVFGFDQKTFKTFSIHHLMDSSMHQSHKKMIEKWMETGSWKNAYKIREVYPVNSKQTCFQATMYLNIIQTPDSLNIVGTFFLVNKNDIMIVDQKGIIIQAGDLFQSLLGKQSIGIPFNAICESSSEILKRQNDKLKLMFHSLINQEKKIEEFKKLSRVQASDCYFKDEKEYLIQIKVKKLRIGESVFKIIEFVSLPEKQSRLTYSQKQLQNDSSQQLIQENNQNQQINCGTSSLTSSIGKTDLVVQKIFETIYEYFHHPSKMKNSKIVKFIVLIVLICILGLVLVVVSQTYRQSNEEIQMNILKGIEDRNYRMNRLYVIYYWSLDAFIDQRIDRNKFLKLWSQIKESIKMSTHELSVTTKKSQIMLKNMNSLEWKMDQQHSVKITPFRFQQNLLFNFKNIFEEKDPNSNAALAKAQLIHQNFPLYQATILSINHDFSQFIASIQEESFMYTQIIEFICLILGFILLFLILAIGWFRNQQRTKLLMQFGFIDKSNCLLLKEYFTAIESRLVQDIKASSTQKQQTPNWQTLERDFVFIQKRQNENRLPSSQSYNVKRIVMIVVIVLVGCCLNAMQTYYEYNVKIVASQLSQKLNEISLSENQMFKCFARIKSHLVLEEALSIDKNFVQQCELKRQSIGILLLEINQYFRGYSNHQEIIQTLSQDVCTLLGSQLRQQCQNQELYSILSQGFLIKIDSLQKNLVNSAYKLEKNQLPSDVLETGGQLKNIQRMMRYLPEYYRTISSILIKQTSISISNYQKNFRLMILIRDIIGFSVTLFGILFFYRSDTQKNSENMGRILIMPLPVVKATKFMAKEITSILKI